MNYFIVKKLVFENKRLKNKNHKEKGSTNKNSNLKVKIKSPKILVDFAYI
jgi:hypothetical protein